VRNPDEVLKEVLRVGRRVIVSFPNFARLATRFHLGLKGRAPVSPSLPYEWYNTPNLHFLSLMDFTDYCKKNQISEQITPLITHQTSKLDFFIISSPTWGFFSF
jgi:methionine biosynthesis protein MetW